MRNSLVLVAAVLFVAPAAAEVVVETPWTHIHVGRPGGPTRVLVNTPWAVVRVGGPEFPAPAATPPTTYPTPATTGGPPPVPVQEQAPVKAVSTVPTLAQFAADFKPRPGNYDVTVQNPVTQEPVTVHFTLPDEPAPQVHVHPRSLVFEYDRHDVVIRFNRNGARVRD